MRLLLPEILAEAQAIADGMAALKARSMIYQASEKERVATTNGLRANAYYNLPYEQWRVIRATASHREAPASAKQESLLLDGAA